MKTVVPLLLVSLMALGKQSHASALFYDSCIGQTAGAETSPNQYAGGGEFDGYSYVLVSNQSGFAGMSCQDLKSMVEGMKMVSIAILPATSLMKNPAVAKLTAASLETLGIAVGGTAVLSVTVFGAIGFATVYIVMKQSLNECEKMDKQQFKQDVIREIEKTLKTQPGSNPTFEIRMEGGAA
jgi:hypothetical protein